MQNRSGDFKLLPQPQDFIDATQIKKYFNPSGIYHLDDFLKQATATKNSIDL
jgi:hypothetical protein